MRPFSACPALKANLMDNGHTNAHPQLDRFAIFLSGLCLLHCLALPFAALFGSAIGGWLVDTETGVHWLLLALAIPVSLWALIRGYRAHAQPLNLVLGITGLVIMFLGVSHWLGERYEVALTVVGVIAVMVAHIRNALAHIHLKRS